MQIAVIDEIGCLEVLKESALCGDQVWEVIMEEDVQWKAIFDQPPDVIVYFCSEVSTTFLSMMTLIKKKQYDIDFLICTIGKAFEATAISFVGYNQIQYLHNPSRFSIVTKITQIKKNRVERHKKLVEKVTGLLKNFLLYKQNPAAAFTEFPCLTGRYLVIGICIDHPDSELRKKINEVPHKLILDWVTVDLQAYKLIVFHINTDYRYPEAVMIFSDIFDISGVVGKKIQKTWQGIFSQMVTITKEMDARFFHGVPDFSNFGSCSQQTTTPNIGETSSIAGVLKELANLIPLGGFSKIRCLELLKIWVGNHDYLSAQKIEVDYCKADTYGRFLTMLPPNTSISEKRERVNTGTPEEIHVVIEYIRENYARELTLEMLCQVAHLSKSHLCQTFKKHTQMSCKEYQTNLRMEAAEKLLRETNMRVYEISEKVGYNNCHYFVSVFRQYHQMTPTSYRNENEEVLGCV